MKRLVEWCWHIQLLIDLLLSAEQGGSNSFWLAFLSYAAPVSNWLSVVTDIFHVCSFTPGKFQGSNTQTATPAYYSLFPSNKTLFHFHTTLLTVQLIKLWKFRSSEMLRFVLAWIISDVSKELSAFILRIKQFKKMDSLILKVKALRTVGIYTRKKPNIPEDLNLQQHRCENLKCRKCVGVFYVMYIEWDGPVAQSV